MTEFYETFKERYQYFLNFKKKENQNTSEHIYEDAIGLIPKPDKGITRKLCDISLINIGTKNTQ